MRRRHPKKQFNALVCEELEPRLLLSADLMGVAVDPASTDAEQQVDDTELQAIEAALQSDPLNQTDEPNTSTQELVIIDPTTPDYLSLLDDLIGHSGDERSFEIILLDSADNGIDQLSEILTEYRGLDAIHLISHGSEGEIRLGDTILDLEELQQESESIHTWGDAFAQTGDLLIYGCNLAATEEGELLVGALAHLTGADVAASDDLTGHESLGGDWELEFQEGEIETLVLLNGDIRQSWQYVLYDASWGSDNTNEWITNVTFGDIDNTSGADAGGYGDYTSVSATIIQGSSTDLSVTINPAPNDYISVWIDWNQDDDFEDAGEEYVVVADTSLAGPHTISITAPNDAALGSTQMRVSLKYWTAPPSSGMFNWGEVEDYTITVTTANVAPVLNSASLTVIEGQTVTLSDANFGITDPDDSSLTYTVSSVTGGYFQLSTNAGVSITTFTSTQLSANEVQFVDDGNEMAPGFDVTVNDGEADSNTLSANVNYTSINDAPVITSNDGGAIANINVAENQTIATTVTASDEDLPADTLTYSISGGADAATFNINSTTGELTFITAPDYEAPTDVGGNNIYDVQVQVSDGNGGTDTQNIAVAVRHIDAPMDIAFTASGQVTTGQLSGTLQATDPNAGDTITYSLVDDAGGMFSIDANTGELIWTGAPDTSTAQSYNVTVRATDSGGLTYDEVMTISTGTDDLDSITGTSHDDLIYGLSDTGVALGPTNHITNGSFESGGSPSSAGWTDVNGAGFDIEASGNNSVTATDGSYYLDMKTAIDFSIIEQAVAGLTNGIAYQLSLDAGLTGVGDGLLNVYWNGVLLDTIDPASNTLQTYSYNVVAGSGDGTNTVRFDEDGPNPAQTTAIDNVRMYEIINGGDILDGGAGDDILIGDGISGNGSTSQSLTINDAGFEDIALPDGGTTSLSAAWTDDFNNNEVFIGDPSTFDFSSGAPAEGENALLIPEDNQVSQTLASNFNSGNDYELSLQIGNPISSGNGGAYSVQLYAGGTLIGSATGTEPASDTWVDVAILVDGEAYAAADGSALRIVLSNTSPFTGSLDYFAVDDIQLNEITATEAGDDTLTGGAGDDYIDGGAGTDTAIFSGYRADYNITWYAETGELVVSDTRGESPDGTDTLIDVEMLQFTDQTITITDPSVQFNDPPENLQATATASGGLSLNEDGGNDAYLIADDGGAILGGLTELTAEVRFSMESFPNSTHFFSYATAGDDNALNVLIHDSGDLRLRINGVRVGSSAMDYGTLADGEQHTLSVTWNSTGGVWEMFVDGISTDSGSGLETGVTLAGGGTLVMGNDQDSVDGGYDPAAEAAATLYDARIFNIVRSGTDITDDYAVTVPNTETGLIANWTFNDLSADGVITDTVSGNDLTVNHASGTGFIASNAELTFEIAESTVPGTIFGTVSATDLDGDTLTYSISGGVDAALFSINSSTGELSFNSFLDYENPTDVGGNNVYDVQVQVDDGNGGTDTQDITVTVTDDNDAPVIDSASLTISEGQTVTLSGANFGITDQDSSSFTYTVSGVTGGYFQLSTNAGVSITTFTSTQLSANEVQFVDDGNEMVPDFDVTVNDGEADSNTLATSITYTAANDAVTDLHYTQYIGGGEFLVNTITSSSQDNAEIVTLSDGSFVVVWESYDSGAVGDNIRFQRYDSNGNALGVETLVNTTETDAQKEPQLSALNDGGFVIVWQSDNQDSPNNGIFGRVFNADGSARTGEFQINTFTTDDQTDPHVATLSGGDFVVVWESSNQDSSGTGVYSQRYDASGNALGTETQLHTETTNNQSDPKVSALSDGGYIVVWESEASGSYEVKAQRFDAAGGTVGAEFQINTTTSSSQDNPAVALLTDGSYVVVWESSGDQDGDSTGIFGQLLDNTGTAVGSEFQINSTFTGAQLIPVVIANDDGGFFVAWQSPYEDGGTDYATYVQQFDASANKINGEILINEAAPEGGSSNPALTLLNDGRLATVYQSYHLDGVYYDVFGRIFTPTLSENTANGTVVAIASQIVDPDSGDTHTFTLLDDAGGAFGINTSTGAITVADTGLINFETASTMNVTVRVTDGGGLTHDEVVTIAIINVDEYTPVANADSISVAEGGTATSLVSGATDVLSNDTGLGDTPVTVSLVTGPTQSAAFTLNTDGTFSYTHNGSENFTDSFTYRVTDNDGQTSDATVTINITPVSDATPVAVVDSINVAEGGTATTLVGGATDVLSNDTGLGDTPVTVSLVTGPTQSATFTLNADGTFSYTHNGSENFTDSFTYRVTDNDGQTSDATVNITVTPVSDQTPVAVTDTITVAEGGTATTLVGGATDVLSNDTGLGDTPVTVSLVTGPTQSAAFTLNTDGTFSYTHNGSENFTDSFTYRVTDNDGQTSDATVTINVTPVSDATPVAVVDSINVAESGTATTLVGGATDVLSNDTGLGDTPVTVSLVTGPTQSAAFTLNTDGTFSYTHNGSENFTDSFIYRVTDNDGQTSDATVNITVTPVSDQTPVAVTDTITVAEGGTATTLVGGATDVLSNDTGLGDTPVTVSLVTGPTQSAAFTLNADGTFSYTHNGSENFTDSFIYRVTDNDGQTSDATVTINITPVSDQTPVAVVDTITVAEGATITTLVGGSNTVLNNDTGLGDTPVTVSLVTGPTQSAAFTLNADGTFSYTHNGSENFTDSFIYRVTDNDGQTSDATVTINITPVSDQTPVAVVDTITVAEGATITTLVGGSNTVLNNDTGLGDTPVTVSLVTGPTESAAFTLNTDGTFSYTHNGSENFTDSFTYRVTDNDGQTSDATVTINITPVSDQTPVAVVDTITVAEGATITTLVGGSNTVLNNDTGLGDAPVTVSLVTGPTQSSAFTLNADGTFSYTHNGSENFTDSFVYRVTDNDGQTSDATITINITPVSDATPVAVVDSINVAEGGTATTLVGGATDVLNNDTGLGDTPVTVSLVTGPTQSAAFTLNADGTFSYTHNGSENFTDSFTYRITDNDGQTSDAMVTINVTPVSDATPVAVVDSITVAEGGTATTLVGGATDVLNNDTGLGDIPVTVSLVTGPTQSVAFTLNADGTFSYTHNGSENFTDSFTYRVTDNDGQTSDAMVTINVTPVSDATPVAVVDSITVAEGGTATTLVGGATDVLNNDTGLGDTPLTVSLVTGPTQSAAFTLNTDGTFSYTHNGSENFTDSFTYRVTDNDGQTSDATVTINVTPVSDATPVAVVDSINVAEGGTATTLVGGATDVLSNDTGLGDTPVTVSLVTGPTESAAFTLNTDGTFSYTHNGSENFTDSFTYRVTDNDGQTSDATVTINVTPVSDATPVAVVDSINVAEGGTATTLVGGATDVLSNDTGLGDTPLTVSLVTGPTESAAFTLNTDGTFSYTHNGSENFTDSFTYRVTDNDGQTSDATVTINVTPVSDATPVAVVDSISVAEGGTATTLVGGATDVLSNDTGLGDTPVTVSLVTGPTQSAAFTLNANGTFSYTHNGSENFTDSFTYRVTDNDGQISDATINITVTPVSDATPVAVTDTITVAEGGTVTTLVGGATDVLNNDTGLGDTPVTVSLVTGPTQSAAFTLNTDGTFSYTHNGSENFTDSFIYRVTDNDGQTSDATVTINVTPVSNATPVAVVDSINVAEGGTATTLVGGATDVLSNDTGLGDTPVTVSLVTGPTQSAAFTLNTDGTFSYTHNGSENFTDSFVYRVTDSDGDSSDATVIINVTSNNNAPVASGLTITVLEDAIYTGNLPVAVDDDGDVVIYHLDSSPTHGSVSIEADGRFSYTPEADYHGVDSFSYSVSDDNGGINRYLVEIEVTSVNDAPIITSHSGYENIIITLDENSTNVTTLFAEDPDNDSVVFEIDAGTDLGLFSIDPISGELAFNNAPDMENPLDSDQDNQYQVQVLVSDGNGGTDRQTFTVEIRDVDEFDVGLLMDMEEIPNIITLSDSLNNGVGITAWAEDPDYSDNQITYTLDDDSNGLFAINPSSGMVTLVSAVESRDISQFEITIRATSEDGSYSLKSFIISLNRLNELPSEPEEPYLDDIILDLIPESPVDPPVTMEDAGPSDRNSSDPQPAPEGQASDSQEFTQTLETEESATKIDQPTRDYFTSILFSGDRQNDSRLNAYHSNLTPVPVTAHGLPVFDTTSDELIEVPDTIWHLLDSMNRDMSKHQEQISTNDGLILQSATFGTLALSAGYVAWLLRAGVLSASLLSSIPLWRQIDPLPVLSAQAKRRDERQDNMPDEEPDNKRIAKLFDRMKKSKRARSIFPGKEA